MPDPNATPAPLTPEQRIHRAHEMITALCKPRGSAGSREWMMTIPARPDHDPDLVIGDGLDAGREALAELDATRAKLAEAEARYAARGEYLAAAVRDKQAAESRVAALQDALERIAEMDGEHGRARALALTALSPSQDAKEAKT